MNNKSKSFLLLFSFIFSISFFLIDDTKNTLIIWAAIFLTPFFIANHFMGFCIYLFLIPHEFLLNYRLAGIGINNLMVLCVGSVFFIYYFMHLIKDHDYRDVKKIYYFIPGFLISLIFVSFINNTTDIKGVLYYCIRVFLFVFMIIYYVNRDNKLDIILNIAIISGLVITLVGFLEVILHKTFFYSAWTQTNRTRFGIIRMGSTVGDPNFICFAVIPIIPIVWYYFKKSLSALKRNYYKACFITMTIGILLTFSRIGYIAFIAVFILHLTYQFSDKIKSNPVIKYTFILLGVLSFLGIAYYSYQLLTNNMQGALGSTKSRMEALKVSCQTLRKSPLSGVGFNKLEYENSLYIKSAITKTGGLSSMNTYLYIFAENGVIVGVFFLLIVLSSFFNLLKFAKEHELAHYMKLGFISWLLIALTLDSLGTSIFWVYVAIANSGVFKMKSLKNN